MKKLSVLLVMCLGLFSCGKQDNIASKEGFLSSDIVALKGANWPLGYTIPVTIIDDSIRLSAFAHSKRTTVAELVEEVKESMNTWSTFANINFEYYPTPDAIPAELAKYPHVRITFLESKGNWAIVGPSYINDKRPFNMSLEGIGNTSFTRKSTMTHEFGHVLGLVHEHQHPDRIVSDEEIKANCKLFGLSEASCKSQMLDKHSAKSAVILPYVENSIMHYEVESSARPEGIVGGVGFFTEGDAVAVTHLYPGRFESTEQFKKTYENALADSVEEFNEAVQTKNCFIAKPNFCPKNAPFQIAAKVNGMPLLKSCVKSIRTSINTMNAWNFCH